MVSMYAGSGAWVSAAISSCASFGVSGSRLASRRASQTTDGLSSSDDWFRCSSSARWTQLTWQAIS